MKWTPEEDQILRDNYHDCSWDELLRLLPGRSKNSVKKRASSLGFSRLVKRKYKDGWLAREDQILQAMYWDRSREEILDALPGRSWHGIHSRAARTGLRRKHVRKDHKEMTAHTDKRVMDAVIKFFYETGFGPQRADVARATGMAHSGVARSVERLINRGLLVRQPHRFSAIGLAPAVRRRIAEHERSLRDRFRTVA